MQKLSSTLAILSSAIAITAGEAWAQSTITDASKHPTGGQLLEGVKSWASSHTGAAAVLGLSVVVAIGLVVYNRFIAGR